MDVFAYAKLNLALKVIGRRPDNYHELDMVMQEISLADLIRIEKSGALRVRASIPLPADNTLVKAARVFFEHTKIRGGADIQVQKNIPAQAGLGGGSSDGAAVLRALNALYGTGLGSGALTELAGKIGADVPFFILGGCARAQGTGEVLTPLQNNIGAAYLLAKPPGGVGTREAYETYRRPDRRETDIEAVADALHAGDLRRYAAVAANDLAPAAMQLCPDIKKIAGEMKNAACAMVTGSGSCVFGVYPDKKTALGEKERLLGLPFVDFVYIAESR